MHTALALYQIEYGSKESIELTEAYFLALNYHSLVASNQIAQERGETFFGFEKSKYADGSYFDPYLENEFTIVNEKVKNIFANIQLPTVAD